MAKWRLDPVCKTKVDKEKAKYRNKIEGEDVYFCSIECKQEFDQ
ncbi:MAG TPA: YHS domain-containing protein [Syntrophales bacterium]|nr:YHS domain-containing protein [Syntrophales bacterium]